MEKEIQKKQIEDMYNVIRDVLKNWWVILFIAISASLLTYIASAWMYHPTYTSSTTFVVSAKGSSTGAYANQSQTEKLTDTFQSVMNSQILKKKVSESLNMDSFPGTVKIEVVPETNLLTVSVTSDSPEVSFKLLKSMLEHYQDVSKNVLGEVVMEVFEAPNFPSAADVAFQGRSMMKKGFLAGVALMIVLLALLSYQKDNVKSEEEVPEKLDTTVFGTLNHESAYRNLKARLKRQKKKILITEPAVSFEFVETIKKMRTKLLYYRSKQQDKVLLVTSAMKKEGKTIVAANLALAMAQRGKKVLLIEGDLRKSSLAAFLNVEVPEGAGFSERIDPDLESLIFQVPDKSLYLLPNNVAHKRSTEFLGSQRFAEFLENMRAEMDFIIIDGPAAKGRADVEVLARRADFSLLVVKQNYTKVPYINDTIDMLDRYGHGVAGCVFNDVLMSGAVFSSGYGYGYDYGYGYGKYRYGRYHGYGKYHSYYYNRTNEEQEKVSQKEEETR